MWKLIADCAVSGKKVKISLIVKGHEFKSRRDADAVIDKPG